MPLDAVASGRWSISHYLGSAKPPKVLVVGCGSTPQNVTMGSGEKAIQGISCSLGRTHSQDFTLDVSTDANADLTIDLVTFQGTELGVYGRGRFDQVDFEYLCGGLRHRFSQQHIRLWIDAADKLLKPTGTIVFYSGCTEYLHVARGRMIELGYKCVDTVIEPDGTPKNMCGHRFCQGVKRNGWMASMFGMGSNNR